MLNKIFFYLIKAAICGLFIFCLAWGEEQESIIVSQFNSNVVLIDGKVYCWGDIENCGINLAYDSNQITSEKNFITKPMLIKELSTGVTSLSSFDLGYVAVKDGKIFTWGQAFASDRNKRAPVELTEYGSDNLKAFGNYQNNFCAVKVNNKVKCAFKNIQVPTLNEFLSNISKVEMGGSCVCFLKSKSVYCISEEKSPCQGVGLNGNPNVPLEIEELKNKTVDISSYGGFFCALSVEGGIYCWGNIEYGTDPQKILVPTFYSKSKTLESISRPTQIDFNSKDASKIKLDAFRICVKDNYQGLSCLGVPIAPPSLQKYQSFVPIIHTVAMSDFSLANGDRLCSVATNGNIKCIGDNMWGRLGIGIFDSSSKFYYHPQEVKFLSPQVEEIKIHK